MSALYVVSRSTAAAPAEEHNTRKGAGAQHYGSMSVHDLRDLLPPELKVRGSQDRGGCRAFGCPLLVVAQFGLARIETLLPVLLLLYAVVFGCYSSRTTSCFDFHQLLHFS